MIGSQVPHQASLVCELLVAAVAEETLPLLVVDRVEVSLDVLGVLGGVGAVLAMVQLEPLGDVRPVHDQAVVAVVGGQVKIEVGLRGEPLVAELADKLLQLEVHPLNVALRVGGTLGAIRALEAVELVGLVVLGDVLASGRWQLFILGTLEARFPIASGDGVSVNVTLERFLLAKCKATF